MSVENELKHINHQLEVHENKDDTRFAEILTQLRENYKIHVENQLMIADFVKKDTEYANTVKSLAILTSDNSGRIEKLEATLKKEAKATQFINDVTSFGLITKWIFYFILGLASLYVAGKTLFSGWLQISLIK